MYWTFEQRIEDDIYGGGGVRRGSEIAGMSLLNELVREFKSEYVTTYFSSGDRDHASSVDPARDEQVHQHWLLY